MKKLFFAVATLLLALPPAAYAYAQALSGSGTVEIATTSDQVRSVHMPTLIYHSVRPYYPEITDMVKEFTVPPNVFDDQLKYLKDNGFTAITMNDLVQYLTVGKPLPPKPVMITLDDGWENQYTYAFPILQKYHMPAVFYVYARAIGVKHFLTWNQLKIMRDAGMEIASHTYSHPELPKVVDDVVRMSREIYDSKKLISDRMGGLAIKDFAYPFGEYDDRVIQVVQGGYQSARTVHSGNEQKADMMYTLHGTIITGDFNRFVSYVNK